MVGHTGLYSESYKSYEKVTKVASTISNISLLVVWHVVREGWSSAPVSAKIV